MSATVFIFVPLVVFLVIVAPLWLILHYWSNSRAKQGLSEEDLQAVEEMTHSVEKLTDRINNLEAILDEQHTGWRNRNH